MKYLLPTILLALGLTLSGCHQAGLYSAMAELQLRPRAITGGMSPPHGYDDPDHFAQIVMLSPDMLTPVIQTLNLDHIWARRLNSDHDVLSPQQALDHLRTVLKIETMRGANIIKVTAYAEVPQEAANIANAVVDHYKALRDREEEERKNRGIDALREQIADQQKVVLDRKVEMEKLRQTLGETSPLIPQNDSHRTPFRDAQLELTQSQNLLDALNVRLKQVLTDQQWQGSPVRILIRAIAPPE